MTDTVKSSSGGTPVWVWWVTFTVGPTLLAILLYGFLGKDRDSRYEPAPGKARTETQQSPSTVQIFDLQPGVWTPWMPSLKGGGKYTWTPDESVVDCEFKGKDGRVRTLTVKMDLSADDKVDLGDTPWLSATYTEFRYMTLYRGVKLKLERWPDPHNRQP